MQEGLWGDILDRLEQQYGKMGIERLRESREDDTGQKLTLDIERVEFTTPMGKMRVEQVVSPLILDKKTHYTHTAGARANVEFVLSDTEKTTKVRVFRYDEDIDEWVEINSNAGFLA